MFIAIALFGQCSASSDRSLLAELKKLSSQLAYIHFVPTGLDCVR